MWRISVISDDWVDKGCHIHIRHVELSVHPDHLGGIVFRRVFSSTLDADYHRANQIALDLLGDGEFVRKLATDVRRAMNFLQGITGYKRSLALGRLREFNFILVALEKLEAE